MSKADATQWALMFFFLEKLGIVKITFHRIDPFKGVFDLPTERRVPSTMTMSGNFCHTWSIARCR